MLISWTNRLYDLFDAASRVDYLAPLAVRLYLAPVFWVAGMNKVAGFDNVVEWFGNPEWGLGLPVPWLMALLATATEVGGAVLLLLGLGTRIVSMPLMITMVVAITAVHWDNGWQAVHDPQSPYASEWVLGVEASDAREAGERLSAARDILREHGDYAWLTGKGSLVVSNSGIEWAATYFVMLLTLFFTGGGRFVSADHWLARYLRSATPAPT
jgi:putative oxidoreductase